MEKTTKFIWVVSYPKSGNTWMRLMLREYFKETTGREPFETNDTSLYWYQTVSPKPINTLTNFESMQLRPAAMMHMTTIYGYRLRPRPACVVKSHTVSGEYHGIAFFSPLWVDHAVYIHRDPRDVLPSMADHLGYTLEEAAEAMADHTTELGDDTKVPQTISTWGNHVMSWINNQRVDTMVTSYEKMHEDAGRELRRVLKHCGIEIDDEAVEKAVEACQFDNLQDREAEEGFVESSPHHEKFFRRGEVGSHKDEVPPHLVKKIISDHTRAMREAGYL